MAGEGTSVGRIFITLGLKNEMDSGLAGVNAGFKQIENSAKNVGKNVENSLGNSLKNVSTQSSSLGSTISNSLGKAFSGISSKITSSLSSARAAIASFSSTGVSAFNGLVAAGERAYAKMGFFGTAMAAIFTVKLKDAIMGATNVFMTFDDQMRKVQAVTESTGTQFDELTAQARLLGATTSFTAQEAADAMTLLGQAGFDANQVMAAMPATLNLARASMTELSTTADIMSNIMNGFRIGAEDTARVSDVLSKAANATNTNVTELGNAMKYVAPLAYQMGWSLEETASAAGLLSNAGIKSSMAGTVLRNAIARLLSPTEKAATVLQSYGLSIDAVSPKTHNFAQIIDILSQSGISAADIMTVFGMRAGPGILAMMNIGTGAIKNMNQELMNSAGYAQEAADKMDAGWGGTIRRLNDMVEALQITFGKAFATILTPFLRLVSAIGVAISKLPSPIIYLASAFALVAVAAGTLLVALAALPVIVSVIGGGLEVFTSGTLMVAMGIAKLSAAGGILGTVFTGLASTIAVVVPYLGLIVAGLAALGIAFYEIEKKTQLFSKSWETLKDLWTIGTYYLGKAFDGLKKVVVNAIDGIVESLRELSEDTWLGNFVTSISNAYNTIAGTLGKWRASTHETAEAIREDEAKQAESTTNVQKQIENAHNGIISSYQTVDEATGETYTSMIENATEGADGVVGANGEIISSNSDLINSNEEVAKSFSYKMQDTDISSVVSEKYGIDDFNSGIQLADGGFVKLNEKGQLVYETVEGISKILADLPSMSLKTADGGTIQTQTDVKATPGEKRRIKVGEEGKAKNAEDEAYMKSSEYTASQWAKDHPDYTQVELNKYPGYSAEQIKKIESGEWDKPIVLPDKTKSTKGMSNAERNAAIAKENQLTPEQAGTIPNQYKNQGIVDPEGYAAAQKRLAQEKKGNIFGANITKGLTDDIGWSGFFKTLLKGDIATVLGGEAPKKGGTIDKTIGALNYKIPGAENYVEGGFDLSGVIKSYDTLKGKMKDLDGFSFSNLKSSIFGVGEEEITASGKADKHKGVLESLIGTPFSNLKNSILGIGTEQDTAKGKGEEHKGILDTLGGVSLSGLWGQISGVGTEQDTAKGKGEEHKGILDTLGGVSLSGLWEQITGVGTEQDTAKVKGEEHKGILDTLGGTSFSGLWEQITGIGSEQDTAGEKGTTHKGILDLINSTSMGSIIGQVLGIGTEEDTSTTKGGFLKTALDLVEGSKMGGIISQIFGVGTETDTTSRKTNTLTTNLRIAASVAFTNTINSIKSVISTINDAITAAGKLITKLYEAAKAKVSDYISGSSGNSKSSSTANNYTANEAAARKANNTVYNNNKNTINNNGDKLSASKAKAAGA